MITDDVEDCDDDEVEVWEVEELLEEESSTYPPAPAAITIITIAITTAIALLIARFFLTIMPTTPVDNSDRESSVI